MKNTDLVLLKKKIQICILMKNTDLVLLKEKKKKSDLYFNEKYRFDFYYRKTTEAFKINFLPI